MRITRPAGLTGAFLLLCIITVSCGPKDSVRTIVDFWDSAWIEEDTTTLPGDIASFSHFLHGFTAAGDSGRAMKGRTASVSVFAVSHGDREVQIKLSVPPEGGRVRVFSRGRRVILDSLLTQGVHTVTCNLVKVRVSPEENILRIRWDPGPSRMGSPGRLTIQEILIHSVDEHSSLSSVRLDTVTNALTMGEGGVVQLFGRLRKGGAIRGSVTGDDAVARVVVHCDEQRPFIAWQSSVSGVPQELSIDLGSWQDRDVVGISFESSLGGGQVVWRDIALLNIDPPAYVVPEESPAFREMSIVDPKQNVLVYLVDTLRRDHLEIYGYQRATAPNLARGLSEWFIFDDCQSLSSWTKAATATLLTGVDPMVHTAIDDDDSLSADVALIWEPLHEAGFETALFTSNGHISDRWGFTRGIDHYRRFPERAGRKTLHIPADSLHEAFLKWIDDRRSEAPFFAYIHATDPHIPYTPPLDLIDAFYPGAAQRLEEFTVRRLAHMICPGRYPSWEMEAAMALYDAEIAGWDRSFAGLLDSLAVRGLLDETIVLVTSDHGEEFAEHGGFSHGMTLYREQLDIPLLLRVPKQRGQRMGMPLDHRDVSNLLYWVLSGRHPNEWQPPARSHRIAHLSLRGLEIARYQTPSFTVLWNVSPMRVCDKRAPSVEMYLGDDSEFTQVSDQYHVVGRACRGALLEWMRRLPNAEARMSRLDDEMIQRLRYLGYLTDE